MNEKILSKLISLFFCIFIFTFLFFKNISLKNTYFDLGIYYNQINYFLNGDYWIIFFGHFSPYIFFISFFSKIVSIDILLILINCVIIYITAAVIFRYYSFKHQLIFLFFFPIYHVILHDFHIEILIIPIVLLSLIYIENAKYKLACFLSLSILFLKISLYPSLISLGIYFLIKDKKKYGYFLILIGLLILLIYYLFIRNLLIYNEFDQSLIFSGLNIISRIINTDLFVYTKSFLIGVSSLVFAKIAINYHNIIDKGFWITISPIFIYYLLSGNLNYLMLHYHYFYQFIPYLFFFAFLNKIIFIKQVYVSILFFIFFSISPLSILYYTNTRDLFSHESFFDYKKGIELKKIILNYTSINRNDSNISISNSIVFKEYLEFKSVYPFGQDQDGYITMPNRIGSKKFSKYKIDYFIIDKKNNYVLDKKVSEKYYINLISEYKKKYNIIFENNSILILQNEL